MEVKIGKGLLSQIGNPFESSNNKITLDDLSKFLKEMGEPYNHRVDTGREYCARLVCKDVKVRNVQVVGIKKESDELCSKFYIRKRQIASLFLHHTTIL